MARAVSNFIKDSLRHRRLIKLSVFELNARLHVIANRRDDLSTVFTTVEDVQNCRKRILFAYLRRDTDRCIELCRGATKTLTEIEYFLYIDSLYLRLEFKKILIVRGRMMAKMVSGRFAIRRDQIVRRSLMWVGRLSDACAGLSMDDLDTLDIGELMLRADLWSATGMMDQATTAYEHALRRHSHNPIVKLRFGFHQLKSGHLFDGLANWGAAEGYFGRYPLRVERMQWRGEPLQSRTLFVIFEHGYGDMVQFLRFLPQVRSRWPDVKLVAQVPGILVSLFSRSLPDVTFVIDTEPDPAFDYYVSAIQLPLVLEAASLAPVEGYIELATASAPRTDSNRLRVGVCWRGQPREYELVRSIPLETFSSLFDMAEFQFVVLLHNVSTADRAILSRHANVECPRITDFGELGDAMANCDVVVSVDTAVVHVAGAAGVPALLLCRPDACWRWGWKGQDSAWYRSVRILRHPLDMNWVVVLEAARTELRNLAARSRNG